MELSTITLEIKDHIAVITLNRPPTNSVNMAMREDLEKAVNEVESDSDIRVIIITGAGEKGFSAGMDVTDVGNLKKGPDAIELYNRIDRLQKPVIAAINGYALGGGCELALACHFRFMADAPKAKIGCPELNLGITPGWGGIQRMVRLLGRQKAMDLIFFSRKLTAGEALGIGLIDKVFPEGKLMEGTMEFAETLSKRPPLAVSAVIRGMTAGIEKGMDEGLKVDRACSDELARSEDAKEGFMAFMQKRDPEFKGK